MRKSAPDRKSASARPRGAGPIEAAALDPVRVRHMRLSLRDIADEGGALKVLADDNESPLAWLARRKGKDGQVLISSAQFLAGEKLRADFTRAQMMPRVTSNWDAPMRSGRGRDGAAGMNAGEAALAARQRVRDALRVVGPEFAGLLMDVCCFLQGLEQIERAQGWPSRSAKIVLQLGLDRLARHYGLTCAARGPHSAALRTWLAEDAAFTVS